MTITHWKRDIAWYFKRIVLTGWYRGRPQAGAGLCWAPQPGLQHRVQRQRRERQQRRGRRPPRRPLLPADKHLEHRLSDRRRGRKSENRHKIDKAILTSSRPSSCLSPVCRCVRTSSQDSTTFPVSPTSSSTLCSAPRPRLFARRPRTSFTGSARSGNTRHSLVNTTILLILASQWSGWCPGPWPCPGTPLPQHPRSRPTRPSTS